MNVRREDASGYEEVPVGESLMILPTDVARIVREERRARTEAAVERHRQEAREREEAERRARDERKAQAAKEKAARRSLGPSGDQQAASAGPAAPGSYRVLPELGRFLERSLQVGASADRDINERNARIRNTLEEKGPDRLLGGGPEVIEALGRLGMELPHFEAPIRSVRNSLILAQAGGVAPRIRPMLLVGPPGLGKTHFSHRLADVLGVPQCRLNFAQPSAGAQLLGSDKYWSNSESGLLFNLLCLGAFANPVVLMDEIDKAAEGSMRRLDPLAQLHAVLEPETARRVSDASTDVEFDASCVTYVATANSVENIAPSVLSRFEIHVIASPTREQSRDIAQAIADKVLQRFGHHPGISLSVPASCVLSFLGPRDIARVCEQAVASAIVARRAVIDEDAIWREIEGERPSTFH